MDDERVQALQKEPGSLLLARPARLGNRDFDCGEVGVSSDAKEKNEVNLEERTVVENEGKLAASLVQLVDDDVKLSTNVGEGKNRCTRLRENTMSSKKGSEGNKGNAPVSRS